jgi:hypothetical protein
MVGVTLAPTVTVIALEVEVAGATQVPDGVMTQVTMSLLTSVVVLKVALLVPALIPFTFH